MKRGKHRFVYLLNTLQYIMIFQASLMLSGCVGLDSHKNEEADISVRQEALYVFAEPIGNQYEIRFEILLISCEEKKDMSNTYNFMKETEWFSAINMNDMPEGHKNHLIAKHGASITRFPTKPVVYSSGVWATNSVHAFKTNYAQRVECSIGDAKVRLDENIERGCASVIKVMPRGTNAVNIQGVMMICDNQGAWNVIQIDSDCNFREWKSLYDIKTVYSKRQPERWAEVFWRASTRASP